MARNPNQPTPAQAEADFEHSMNDLERIVDELEGGQMPLEASLANYEKGMALAKKLTAALDQAEKRIEKLVEVETAEAAAGDEAAPPPKLELKPPGGASEGELPF